MVSIWLEKIIRKDRKWEKVWQKGIRWVLKLCQFSHLSIRMECKLLIGCRVIEFFILHDGASFIGTTLVVEILVYLSSFLSSKGDWIPQLALQILCSLFGLGSFHTLMGTCTYLDFSVCLQIKV